MPVAVSDQSTIKLKSEWALSRVPGCLGSSCIWFCNSWNPFFTLLGGRSRILCILHLCWQSITWRWMVIGTSCLPNIILSAVCIWKQSFLSGLRNKLLMCWFFWKAHPQGLHLQLAEMRWAPIKDIKSECSAVSQQATAPDLAELEWKTSSTK